MIDAAIIPLKEHFSSLDDPRAQHSIEHLLIDIVLVTICAVICGADKWVEIENYVLSPNRVARRQIESFPASPLTSN